MFQKHPDLWSGLLNYDFVQLCVCVHSSSSSSSVCCSKFQSLFDLEPFFFAGLHLHSCPALPNHTISHCPHLSAVDNARSASWDQEHASKHGQIGHCPSRHWLHSPAKLALRAVNPSTLVGQFVLYKGLLGFCASRPLRQIYHFMKLGVWPKSLKIQHATFDVQNQIPVDTVGSLSHNSQCFNLFQRVQDFVHSAYYSVVVDSAAMFTWSFHIIRISLQQKSMLFLCFFPRTLTRLWVWRSTIHLLVHDISDKHRSPVTVGVLESVAFCVEMMAQHTAAISCKVVCSSRWSP